MCLQEQHVFKIGGECSGTCSYPDVSEVFLYHFQTWHITLFCPGFFSSTIMSPFAIALFFNSSNRRRQKISHRPNFYVLCFLLFRGLIDSLQQHASSPITVLRVKCRGQQASHELGGERSDPWSYPGVSEIFDLEFSYLTKDFFPPGVFSNLNMSTIAKLFFLNRSNRRSEQIFGKLFFSCRAFFLFEASSTSSNVLLFCQPLCYV